MMKHKSIPASAISIKNADLGQVEAVFATLDVVDRDGDVTIKGAISDGAAVVISSYGHKSWDGELPVGHGTIHEVGGELVFKGQFMMDTPHGRDTFATVKTLSEVGLGEWSYGLLDVESERGIRDGKAVNVLKSINVPEVSPVLVGVGTDTRTTMTKGTKQLASSLRRLLNRAGRSRWESSGVSVWLDDYDPDDGYAVFDIDHWNSSGEDRLVQVSFTYSDTAVELGDEETDVHSTTQYIAKSGERFSEHAAAVLAAVDGLAVRAEEVVALRAAKGKTISDRAGDLLKQVLSSSDRLKALVESDVTAGDDPSENPADGTDITGEYLRFVAMTQGVTS